MLSIVKSWSIDAQLENYIWKMDKIIFICVVTCKWSQRNETKIKNMPLKKIAILS